MDEEEIIGKAIQESLDLAKEKKISFEPLNPEQRLRKSGVPVGLKNIGNSIFHLQLSLLFQFTSADILFQYQLCPLGSSLCRTRILEKCEGRGQRKRPINKTEDRLYKSCETSPNLVCRNDCFR